MFLTSKQLIVFQNLREDRILNDICELIDRQNNGEDISAYKENAVQAFGELVAICEQRGFYGNLWATYLTNLLVNSENAYSCGCEIGGASEGSIDGLIIHDMEIMHGLFHADVQGILNTLGMEYLQCVLDYKVLKNSQVYNTRIRDRICTLAQDMYAADKASLMKGVLTSFYKQYGVGKLGLHRAFSIDADEKDKLIISPIQNMLHITLADLVGYESQKQKLIENTVAFLNKKPANNCLLYGDAGTGKSSSIKALATEYYESGLRVIQVQRHQFKYLSELISSIKNRNYRFIIYMDDLSFEDFETEYKFLKAIIEGGLEQKPDNILIYATSNRRHLIKETVSDRDDRDPDMHRSDTMAEKLSLSQRFGVQIYYGKPDKKEFNNIVSTLADRYGVVMPEEELILEANKWEISHGGLSGRTARQFIDHLLGLPSVVRSK